MNSHELVSTDRSSPFSIKAIAGDNLSPVVEMH